MVDESARVFGDFPCLSEVSEVKRPAIWQLDGSSRAWETSELWRGFFRLLASLCLSSSSMVYLAQGRLTLDLESYDGHEG
ncbi:hypothetical protein RchiOBHm_Chr3g0496531 [Rosa chinensis]|uniref:Uncharacterized protein n=1 Tax=Rosa chinensis TaxID=74649 RepID=A0A2P6RHI3_ROSCH|nr:hypothetical protein RchiOBHm_Chr3g0496531 [Rosa chinensis]